MSGTYQGSNICTAVPQVIDAKSFVGNSVETSRFNHQYVTSETLKNGHLFDK